LAKEFQSRRPGSAGKKTGEVIMTQQFQHIPEQSSRFSRVVVGTLMSTVVLLAGLLTFAPYSLI
jgi:hypothetical protein